MSLEEDLLKKIEGVLAKFPPIYESSYKNERGYSRFNDRVGFSALAVEVSALADHVYGVGHDMARSIKGTVSVESLGNLQRVEGMLRGTIESIKAGLLVDLRTSVLLDVQTDFIQAARGALDNGAKDTAAALLCVVLEDSIKRLAIQSDLPHLANKDYGTVTIGLFKAGKISKATKGNLESHSDLRNAALHAQWHQVTTDAVRALLQYLPFFIEEYSV